MWAAIIRACRYYAHVTLVTSGTWIMAVLQKHTLKQYRTTCIALCHVCSSHGMILELRLLSQKIWSHVWYTFKSCVTVGSTRFVWECCSSGNTPNNNRIRSCIYADIKRSLLLSVKMKKTSVCREWFGKYKLCIFRENYQHHSTK